MQRIKIFLFFCLLTPLSCFGSLASTIQWDIRTTGASTNSGCFDPGVISPGTDWSQQNTAHTSYTDIVIGATTTQGTSVLNPFSSTDVGNCIQLISGTGCTTAKSGINNNFYEILSVTTGTATFDRSLGSATSICAGNEGGSLTAVTDTAANFDATITGTYNIKAGTYTYTSMWDPCHGACLAKFIGYNTTHNDGGTKPLITTATNTAWFREEGETVFLINLSFSNTASTREPVFLSNDGGSIFIRTNNSKFNGFSTFASDVNNSSPWNLYNTEITGGTLNGITTLGPTNIINCVIHGNTGAGIVFDVTTTSTLTVSGSLIYGNTGAGIDTFGAVAHTIIVMNSSIYGNGSGTLGKSGIEGGVNTILFAINNIIYGNTQFGWNVSTPIALDNFNSFGGNGSGNCNGCTLDSSDITGLSDPFTNAGSGDFSLNNTIGAGALLRGVGFPGTFILGLTKGFIDFGAVQSQSQTIGVGSYAQ